MLNYLTDCASPREGSEGTERGYWTCEVSGNNGRKMKPQSERAKMALHWPLIATKCSARGNKQSPMGPINFEKLRNLNKQFSCNFCVFFSRRKIVEILYKLK